MTSATLEFVKQHADLVFVYGTLRKGEVHHDLLLGTGARFEGLGCFQGRLYDLGEYPGAVPSSLASEQVIGELYRLRDSASSLSVLDELEECNPAHPEVSLFLRRLTKVQRGDGSSVRAWTYLLPREPERMSPILGGDYSKRGRGSESRP